MYSTSGILASRFDVTLTIGLFFILSINIFNLLKFVFRLPTFTYKTIMLRLFRSRHLTDPGKGNSLLKFGCLVLWMIFTARNRIYHFSLVSKQHAVSYANGMELIKVRSRKSSANTIDLIQELSGLTSLSPTRKSQ